jgi:hypothetical protein
MSNAPNTDIFKNVTNVTDDQASALIKSINSTASQPLIGSTFSLSDVSKDNPNPEFDLATEIKPSAIRLAALQSEYNVVMTMYQNAFQDYKKYISENAITSITTSKTTTTSMTEPTPTEPTPTKTHLKINNSRYSDSVGSTATIANIVDAEDCYSSCTLPVCAGATFNSANKTCDLYGSVGTIDESEDIKYKSIIPVKEFPIIVLQMLSDKLGELNEAITKQNAYLNILPSEDAILTKNGTSLTSALIEKNKTDKEISDLTNSIETKLKDSERFVSNKYSIYTLLNAIAMILVAIYVWDFTFSMITLVMIIMIIAINTSIFSGIILFLYIFFYFYFQIGNY